jgi:hypothetical protein
LARNGQNEKKMDVTSVGETPMIFDDNDPLLGPTSQPDTHVLLELTLLLFTSFICVSAERCVINGQPNPFSWPPDHLRVATNGR